MTAVNNSLWGWLILVIAAVNVIFLGGKRRAFGVFVAQLRSEYNTTVSLAELDWIGNSYSALGYFSTSFSSFLVIYFSRRFRLFQFIGSCFILLACISSAYVPNPHWLFLTHSVLHGIGSSIILSVVGLIVNEYFDKTHNYHILATTLISGGSAASVIFVELFTVLIDKYTWRGAFLILGAVYFVVNVSGVFFFKRNEDVEDYAKAGRSCCACDEFTSRRDRWPLLILWIIDRVMTSIVTYGMLMNLADYVMRREKVITKSSGLTMLFAGGEATTYILGAVITAVTRKLFFNRLKYILIITTAIMSAALFSWEAFAAYKVPSYALAYLTGFCLGPSITFLFPGGEELTMLPGHMAYPFSLSAMGLGMAISPLVTGYIAERTNYNHFFSIQGGFILIKCLALLVSIIYLRASGLMKQFGNNEYDDISKGEVTTRDDGVSDKHDDNKLG